MAGINLARCLIGISCVVGIISADSTAFSQPANQDVAQAEQQWSTVQSYCFGCHNSIVRAGDLLFDELSAESVPEHPEIFETAVRKLRGRLMPPPGNPQPSQEEINALVGWLENTLDESSEAILAGHVPVQRMNRNEYANAVKGLLDVEIDPEQLDAALQRYAETLVQSERIRARQIFVPEQAMARRLLSRLRDGADFETVARKQNGGNGDMGWMDVESAPPLLVQVSQGMSEGEISDLHHSSLGYHIFQFLGRRPARPLAPEQARAEIEKLLRSEAIESRFRLWLAARTDVLGLSVDEKAVAKLQCCHLGLPYFGKPGQEDER